MRAQKELTRGMASAAVCCMAAVWEKLLYAVVYSSENQERGQLYGRHTAAYSSFFCCIAVWFAVWNDLMYGVYGVHVDPIQVG